MKVIILLVLLLTPSPSTNAAGQGQQVIRPRTLLLPSSFHHIKRLRPDMDVGHAYYLAVTIERYAKQEKVSARRLVAIAMQESGLRQINRIERGTITDYGMFQFHRNTVAAKGLDKHRLQYDVEYQIGAAARLLRHKINICKKKGMSKPWACYHSATPALAERYIAAVEKYE